MSKETYTNPKTKESVILDTNDVDFEKKRANLETRGYEWERPEADPNVDTLDATIAGTQDVQKRRAPVKPNIETVPGPSYDRPAVANPERDISGGLSLDETLRNLYGPKTASPIPAKPVPASPVPTAVPATARPTAAPATPSPAPSPSPSPVATAAPTPTARPTAQPTAVPTTQPRWPTPAPIQPETKSTPLSGVTMPTDETITPSGLFYGQQGSTGFERPQMGMPQDNFPKGDITPLPNPEIDPALLEGMPESEVQKASKIKLGEQLVDPTATPASAAETLKDPTKSLAEIASQVGAGSVTPDSLKLDTQAIKNFGVNDKTVHQGGQPSVAAPQPQKSPSLDTGAMENFGVNERTLNPITQPEAPTAFQPQEALAADSEERGANWLASHEVDLGGKSLRENVPASPFAGQGQQRINLDIPNPLTDIADPASTGEPPAVPASQSTGTPTGTPPAVPTSPTGLVTSATGNYGVNDRTAPGASPSWDPAKRVHDFLGLGGDTSKTREMAVSTQGQWNDYDPAAKRQADEAFYTAKNQGDLGVNDIEGRLSRIDSNRYNRAAQLAESRGVALEQYMQGLNRNEKKSFIDTIIRSLGQILVGGYDLMSGPKTAAASQYYKGPEAYDKKGADALELQKYGEKIKSAEATEKDISSVETASIDNKKLLEDLRGKVNNDVFRMANDLVKLTQVTMSNGVNRNEITAGYLQLLADKNTFEYALEKMKAEFRLQQAIQDGITRSANARTMAQSKTQTQENVKKDDKEVKKTVSVEAVDKAVNTLNTGESRIASVLSNGQFKTMAAPKVALAEANKLFEAFKANPNDVNRDAYRSSIGRYHNSIRDALKQGVFLHADPKVRTSMNNELDTALNLYYGASARDPSHPFYLEGPEKGLLKMSAYAAAQREEALNGRPSSIITAETGTTEGTSEQNKKGATVNTKTSQKVDTGDTGAGSPAQGPGSATPTQGPAVPGSATPTQGPAVPGSATPTQGPTPTRTATPAKPIDVKLQTRLRELKQVTKKGLLTAEQRAEVARYLQDPAAKKMWDTLTVPPAARPTQGPTPAKPTAIPTQKADPAARLKELQGFMKSRPLTPAEKAEAAALLKVKTK